MGGHRRHGDAVRGVHEDMPTAPRRSSMPSSRSRRIAGAVPTNACSRSGASSGRGRLTNVNANVSQRKIARSDVPADTIRMIEEQNWPPPRALPVRRRAPRRRRRPGSRPGARAVSARQRPLPGLGDAHLHAPQARPRQDRRLSAPRRPIRQAAAEGSSAPRERPDLESVHRVPHVHRHVDGLDQPGRVPTGRG